jgi:hypothetical protein
MLELKRTEPKSAGLPPSQCCSESAANLRTSPLRPYSASRTVNRPVSVLHPRPSPETLSPGVVGDWKGTLASSVRALELFVYGGTSETVTLLLLGDRAIDIGFVGIDGPPPADL